MRIDKFLAERGDYPSRSKAREAIGRGEVMIDGVPARPSSEVSAASEIRLLTDAGGFVSAGGAKLQKALSDFGFSPRGMVFADIGVSTGGFTDCLLKNGAARVYAVDVGVSQLHPRLAGDPRVTVCDRTNARYLTRDFSGTAGRGGDGRQLYFRKAADARRLRDNGGGLSLSIPSETSI